MDEKTLIVLEYPHILEHLGTYASFSASAALVRALRPTNDLELALERLARTSEARRLLIDHPQISIGDAHDISSQLNLAERGGVLSTEELMDIKSTISSARDLARTFEKLCCPAPASRFN
jgi:DNA mismatch repair protein MutS2